MINIRCLTLIWLTSLPIFSMQNPGRIIQNNELTKEPLLSYGDYQKGNGSFGDVHPGKWRGTSVAIKFWHLKSLPGHLISEFNPYNELSHPNLLSFYGIVVKPGKFAMVTELMPSSLYKFYKEHPLEWGNIYNFAEQIARGLSYLHYKGVAHKHLKSSNIFVTNELVIKISDFGLSKIKLESSSNGAKGDGEATVRWRAPETFTREYARIKDTLDAQKSADIYSYGLVVWEMKTRKKPFDTHTETSVVQLLSMGTREEIEFAWPSAFRTLLSNCWSFVPTSRPSIDAILDTLTKEFNLVDARKAPVEGFTGRAASAGADAEMIKEKIEPLENEVSKLKGELDNALKNEEHHRMNSQALKVDLKIQKERSEKKFKETEIFFEQLLEKNNQLSENIEQLKKILAKHGIEEFVIACNEGSKQCAVIHAEAPKESDRP